MVVVEALAFSKPVIASRRGGIPEMICHGENGLLIEPDRPDELLSALRTLIEDTALRLRMSIAARASAVRFLDYEGWLRRHVDVYETAIGRFRTSDHRPSHSTRTV